MLRSVLLLILAGSSGLAAQQLTPAERSRLDSMIGRIVALGTTPAVGVVVVRDTQILYMKGFGFADLEAKRPFTPETVFYTGSTTKAFTGLAAAMLDVQGKLRLDAPISRYLPELQLKPPLNADSITIRALITHSHGIGGGPRSPVVYRLAWTGEYQDDAELIRLLAEHPALPERSFRYSNLGYNVAALAMNRVTGESWKATINRLILAPLGMRSTTGYVSRVGPDRLALPYNLAPEGFQRLPYGKTDATMHSAGGLVTTLQDEARWLEAQLNDGKVDGRQVIPAGLIRASHAFQVSYPGKVGSVPVHGYGIGWFLGVSGGDSLVFHGGGFTGFAAQAVLVPSRRLGVVTFTNVDDIGGALAEMLAQGILDVLAGRSPMVEDSLAMIRSALERTRAGIRADLARRAARPQTLPLPFGAYAGRYVHPLLGSLVFTLTPDGKLEAHAGASRGTVEVYDGTQHQLRVALAGPGQVVQMEVQEGRVISATFEGNRYVRVKE